MHCKLIAKIIRQHMTFDEQVDEVGCMFRWTAFSEIKLILASVSCAHVLHKT